jgi:uncharacterized membrane-anchored protein YjiN (DUF445 family)
MFKKLLRKLTNKDEAQKVITYVTSLVDNKLKNHNHFCYANNCKVCKKTNKDSWPLSKSTIMDLAAKTFNGMDIYETSLNFDNTEDHAVTTHRLLAFANLLAIELHDSLPSEQSVRSLYADPQKYNITNSQEYQELLKQYQNLEEEIKGLQVLMALNKTKY